VASAKVGSPEHWRERADEMRAVAETVDNGEAKLKLLKLAADYEALAERAIKRADNECAR